MLGEKKKRCSIIRHGFISWHSWMMVGSQKGLFEGGGKVIPSVH